jgi:hypothetical protein
MKREREALLGLKVSHISRSSECKRTHLCLLGYCIGCVHVIFSLPKKSHHILFDKPAHQIPQHLVYVEWYTWIDDLMSHHLLHKVSTIKDPKVLRFYSSALNALGSLPGPSGPAAEAAAAATVTPAVAALVRVHFRRSHQIHRTSGPHGY